MICIVDYGVGNLSSMQNMLRKIGVEALISSQKSEIEHASKLILPGVGAFDTCAAKLMESGLVESLTDSVLNRKIPVLGVCVGHQLLFERSEEGELPGLGWIGGRIVRFKKEGLGQGVKIPHMAWANVKLAKPSRLFDSMPEDARFYFVHSYYAQPTDESDSLLFADYGYRFVAGVERSNIVGVQFHPEKSHKFGMRLLNNFCNY